MASNVSPRLLTSARLKVSRLLRDVLNVLLAAIAAAEVERTYVLAEQQAMAAAVIAEIRDDTTVVAARRNAVHRAVAEAIRVSAHGTLVAEDVDPSAPIEVIRADVARRLRGEVPTDFRAAGELMIAVRYLLDRQPGEQLSYGPLGDGVRAAREPVYQRLVALWRARRAKTNTGREMRDLDALFIDLDSVVAQVSTRWECLTHARGGLRFDHLASGWCLDHPAAQRKPDPTSPLQGRGGSNTTPDHQSRSTAQDL
ncbi:hypothetical protein [Mycobacterium kansasii]|uniref:hypothetical protein n=1 Tax=Mycobacterium kansasii TaxID=1768 RepID=UPI0012EBDFCF|nr:hypothetical protein [Mycobacterium kansasii]